MSEQKYKMTLILKFEDLTKADGSDNGSEDMHIENEVGDVARHNIERQLSELALSWGDKYLETKNSGQKLEVGKRPGR